MSSQNSTALTIVAEVNDALRVQDAGHEAVIPPPAGLSEPVALAFARAMAEAAALLHHPDTIRRFAHLVLTELRTKKALQACTPDSILGAVVEMAEAGLDPSGMNEAFLIPYDGKATMRVGYAGLIQLACSHPEVIEVMADEVCVNDDYEFLALDARPRHRYPAMFAPRGRPIGYWAAARLTGDRWRAVQMSVEEILAHAKQYSQNSEKQVWSDGLHGGRRGMSLKTVIRKLCNPKYLPMAPRLVTVLQRESSFDVDAATADAAPPSALEAGKTLADHIEDLTGSPPPVPPAPPLPEPVTPADDRVQMLAQIGAWLRALRPATTRLRALEMLTGHPMTLEDVARATEDQLAQMCRVIALTAAAEIDWNSPTLKQDLQAMLRAQAAETHRELYASAYGVTAARRAPDAAAPPLQEDELRTAIALGAEQLHDRWLAEEALALTEDADTSLPALEECWIRVQAVLVEEAKQQPLL